ncbi:hypothetical protein [Spirosoma litoris]
MKKMARSKEYKAIRNFFVNELGLTKEQIREIAKEAVADEARKQFKISLDRGLINAKVGEVLKNELENRYNSSIRTIISESVKSVVADKLQITIK